MFLKSIIIILTSLSFLSTTSIEKEIIGKWQSDDTSKWCWIITSEGVCYEYYDGVLDDTYNYVISTSKSPSGLNFHYIEMTNINDANEKFVYELEVGDEFLTVYYTKAARPTPMVFNKEIVEPPTDPDGWI